MAASPSSIARWIATGATTLAACLAAPAPAAAQVRVEPSPAALVDPAAPSAVQALFGRNGAFMVAGGVVPGGHAAFFLDGSTRQPIQAGDVRPVVWPDGTVGLRAAGATYRVSMPHGLACPLGQFVARGGVIAYTVPKFSDPDSRRAMIRAGLVRHHIAREFDGTPFETLLKAADFGTTEPLPAPLADEIVAGINGAHGIAGLVMNASVDLDAMIGSYINSGMQVTYHVYLMPAAGRAEIGGVPLRYFWKLDEGGAAGVFSVEIYTQSWPAGTQLAAPGVAPSQYDVVNFYQVAGLFQQLHDDNASAFASFVDQACGSHAPGT